MTTHSPGIIRRFFGGFWRAVTWTRIAVFNLLFLVVLLLFIAALIPAQQPTLGDANLLVLSPKGQLVDEYTYMDPLTQVVEQTQPEDLETLVSDVIKAINLAKDDSDIDALAITLDSLAGGGLSKLEEIGAALARFKTSGKPIYAYGYNLSQADYYLASFADEVHLNPMGMVEVVGFASYRNYFQEALDKLSIDMHIFKVGTYKDAIEPLVRNDMSDASKEHNQRWLDELWGIYSSKIEVARGLPSGAIDNYISTMLTNLEATDGDFAQAALNAKLVDKLSTQLQWQAFLEDQSGTKLEDAPGFRRYLALRSPPPLPSSDPKVGLLTARGTILTGDQPSGEIGDVSFQAQLKQVLENDDIKALVVRVDSGGGSVVASENIRLAIENVKQERDIPIVVSMGSVAASGGYWIATAADEIWATPTTITGSIGVFGVMATLETSLERLGIRTDGLSTSELAGYNRLDRTLSPQAKALMQLSVDNIYQKFITLVAEDRASDPAAIDEIAQGRVWSGNTAIELGLVDQLGNLEDVIARAAELAELNTYEVETIRPELSPVEQFAAQLNGSQASGLLQALPTRSKAIPASLEKMLVSLAQPWAFLDTLNDPSGLYAICFSCKTP